MVIAEKPVGVKVFKPLTECLLKTIWRLVWCLRVFVKDILKNKNWQIVNQRLENKALGVSFDNKSRISRFNHHKCQRVKSLFCYPIKSQYH